METSWYFADKDKNKISTTHTELEAKFRTGELGADTWVWRNGMADWVPAKDHPELLSIFKNAEPPPLPTSKIESLSPRNIETEPCPYCGHLCSTVALVCPGCFTQIRKPDEPYIKKVTGKDVADVALFAGVAAAGTLLLSPGLLIQGVLISIESALGGISGMRAKAGLKNLAKETLAVDFLFLDDEKFYPTFCLVTQDHFIYAGMRKFNGYTRQFGMIHKFDRNNIPEARVIQKKEDGSSAKPSLSIEFASSEKDEKEALWLTRMFGFTNKNARPIVEHSVRMINYYRTE